MTLQQQFSDLSTAINTLLGLLFELLSPEVVSIAGKAVRKTNRPQKDPSMYMESQVSVNFRHIPQCDGAINSTIVEDDDVGNVGVIKEDDGSAIVDVDISIVSAADDS